MSRTAPLWLAKPGRFAGLKRSQARIIIALAFVAIAACLLALRIPEAPALEAVTGVERNQTDLALYEKIVAGMRGGGNYYTVAADALRSGSYPLRPFVTFRLPGLATVQAAMPEPLPGLLLVVLAAITGLAWALRLGEALPRLAPRIVAGILLLGSLLAFVQPDLAAFHEMWAGLLVALSLAVRRPGHWVEAVAIGLIAMLIRETAALYAVIMAIFAWREGARREFAGWAVALAMFGVALGVHAYAVAGVTGPLDPVSPGWTGFQGFGLFAKALAVSTALHILPLWAAAPVVGLALFGWASWRDPLGARMFAVLVAYALVIAMFARLDTFYWGLMVAPVFLTGLAFVPDGVRDLARQALDRRRVTVTRVSQ